MIVVLELHSELVTIVYSWESGCLFLTNKFISIQVVWYVACMKQTLNCETIIALHCIAYVCFGVVLAFMGNLN